MHKRTGVRNNAGKQTGGNVFSDCPFVPNEKVVNQFGYGRFFAVNNVYMAKVGVVGMVVYV